jgi:hypothetical protein
LRLFTRPDRLPADFERGIRTFGLGSPRPDVVGGEAGRQGSQELLGLTDAVSLFREAVAAAPARHHDRGELLDGLGVVLQELFQRTGDIAALRAAIRAGREALAATPGRHPDRAMCMDHLRAGLRQQEIHEHATPADDPAVLSNQAVDLISDYEHSGELPALTDAIALFREAAAAALVSDPNRGTHLNNLGAALRELCGRTGDMEALAEAIQATRDAIAATRVGDPKRVTYLRNLGDAFQELFGRTGDTDTLTQVIQARRDTVTATPDDHPRRAMYLSLFGDALDLSSLGNALRMLSERTGDMEILAEAVQVGRDAVSAISDARGGLGDAQSGPSPTMRTLKSGRTAAI